MPAERVKRKLAAILSADVKGYSRLMGEDEVGTIRTLNIYKEVMTGFIQNHQGRVVGTAGDSVLAEFASVVDAVQCAVEVQKELKKRNADLPENRRMEFRIWINLTCFNLCGGSSSKMGYKSLTAHPHLVSSRRELYPF